MNTTLTGKQTLLFVLVFVGGLLLCCWLHLPPLLSAFAALLSAIILAAIIPQSRRAPKATPPPPQVQHDAGAPLLDSATRPIEIDYRVTMRDRREANQILARKKVPTRSPDLQRSQLFARSNLGWVLFAGMAITLFFILGRGGRMRWMALLHQYQTLATGMATGIVTFFAAFLVLWLFVRYRIKRSIQNLRLQMIFTAEGIEERDGEAVTRVTWKAFYNWSETASIFVLHKNPPDAKIHRGMFIPKRLFATAAMADEFRMLLSEAISP